MSRTKHARNVRGLPVSWKRWMKRNVYNKNTAHAVLRATADQISSELHEMELESLGCEVARDLWPPKFGVKWIGYGAHRVPGFDAWDDHTRYDDHPYDDYRDYGSDRCNWCGGYEGCDCEACMWGYDDGYRDCTEAGWATLWVDGIVDLPTDWREDDHVWEDDYDWSTDYDWDDWYPGETEFWGTTGVPEVPGTETLVAAREAEKLRAGNRYYRQNRRVA